MKTLILFSTCDGQTRKIAFRIAENIQRMDGKNQVDLLEIKTLADSCTINWPHYDRVLIGASIRYGHFRPVVWELAKQYQTQLQERVSGFFSVSLIARKSEKCTPKTNKYTRDFLLRSPWKPDLCAVFAGALLYPRYRWFDRALIRFIMRVTGGETDRTKQVEYTDWAQVKKFSCQFVEISQYRS